MVEKPTIDRRVREMVQSRLNTYSGSDPVWGFVALLRSEQFTGEAAVGLDPRVRLFAVEGHIYCAEREDDAALSTRLVRSGAITAMQLARGSVQAGAAESLARLFQRDATIDRDAVELSVASSTEALLAAIANNPVGMPEVFPLRHHPAGIHHWMLPSATALAEEETPVADEPVAAEPVAAEPVALPTLASFPAPSIAPALAPSAPAEPLEPLRLGQPAPASVTGAGLPLLAAIHDGNPANATYQPPTVPMPQQEMPAVDAIPLPKLADAPVSVRDLKLAAAGSEAWGTTSKNMTAVQIWNMVDELIDDNKLDNPRVGVGAPPPQKSVWRRRKS